MEDGTPCRLTTKAKMLAAGAVGEIARIWGNPPTDGHSAAVHLSTGMAVLWTRGARCAGFNVRRKR
jgi:hypothetical protein